MLSYQSFDKSSSNIPRSHNVFASPETPASRRAAAVCSTPSTRQSSVVFGLPGGAITASDSVITGARLPTNRQVIRCMLYSIESGCKTNTTKWEACNAVLQQVREFYEKANIPMNSDQICCTKMMRLMADNAAIRAIPIKRRDTETSRRRLAAMQTMLDETFIVWPQNTLHIINNDDRAFLRSMMGDRLATFGVRDEKLAGTVRRRLIREQQQTDRQTRHMTSEIATPIDDDDDEDTAGIATTSAVGMLRVAVIAQPLRSHHRSVR